MTEPIQNVNTSRVSRMRANCKRAVQLHQQSLAAMQARNNPLLFAGLIEKEQQSIAFFLGLLRWINGTE